jgi:hypothetical protein
MMHPRSLSLALAIAVNWLGDDDNDLSHRTLILPLATWNFEPSLKLRSFSDSPNGSLAGLNRHSTARFSSSWPAGSSMVFVPTNCGPVSVQCAGAWGYASGSSPVERIMQGCSTVTVLWEVLQHPTANHCYTVLFTVLQQNSAPFKIEYM